MVAVEVIIITITISKSIPVRWVAMEMVEVAAVWADRAMYKFTIRHRPTEAMGAAVAA